MLRRARQHAVAHRHDHLDHPGDAGGGLGVPDVGLERAQPERLLAVPAVGGEQGLRLDRVAELGPGAVGLDGVHVLRPQPRVRERLPDDPLLRGPVRRGQPVGRAVLVDRGAPDDRQDLVPVADRASESRSTSSTPTPSPQAVPSAAAANGLIRPSGASPR